ncbi:S8 family serine peptidase [Pseudoalteromonas luteoviolacea]|uniref:S8 family serine peptidase n=1 Tax=Pseudoalteromonas luteoviolacea TaxID=43657 RepID=UPI001EED81BC|nr:S8 family serine peptidase [Pseudoalteromonas luteoviolacea]MCF6441707.1 S8 family serine peptidase [Pseudoalteromonas luteoviolacea]
MKTLKFITFILSLSCIFDASSMTDRNYKDRWINPKGDPLLKHQWNLLNQNFSQYNNSPSDLNLWQTHIWGHKGKDIKIAVIDSGVDVKHPELVDNLIIFSDINSSATNDAHGTKMAGIIAAAENDIGIRGVAPQSQIVSFSGINDLDDFMVSHGLHESSYDVQVFNQSYGLAWSHSVPYTLSTPELNYIEMQSVLKKVSLENPTDKRSALFVKSAGNGYLQSSVFYLDANDNRVKKYPKNSKPIDDNYFLPWQNANSDHENANYWNMVIGAVNAFGERTSYSTPGSSVFISAPGGDSFNTGVKNLSTTFTCEHLEKQGLLEPSMFIGDLRNAPFISCTHSSLLLKLLDVEQIYMQRTGAKSIDLGLIYTLPEFKSIEATLTAQEHQVIEQLILMQIINQQFSSVQGRRSLLSYIAEQSDFSYAIDGTSSAAANATGAVALLMSAANMQNHQLSSRDIRHLLANTATRIDPNQSAISVNGIVGLEGWSKNAAGHWYSPHYGFGLIDVDKAVELIRRYTIENLPSDLVESSWAASALNGSEIKIPDSGKAVTSVITVNDELFIEAVQVRLDIAHSRISDLKIELESPSGTRSILMSPFGNLNGQALSSAINGMQSTQGYDDHLMLSYKFWNEKANAEHGQWKLHVTDMSAAHRNFQLSGRHGIEDVVMDNNEQAGSLNNWSIRIIGHQEKISKNKRLD